MGQQLTSYIKMGFGKIEMGPAARVAATRPASKGMPSLTVIILSAGQQIQYRPHQESPHRQGIDYSGEGWSFHRRLCVRALV